MRFLYNLLFLPVFLCFLPSQILKLVRRPGEKRNVGERLGIFSGEKKKRLQSFEGAVWLHAVSVGEANLALTLLRAWKQADPARKFVISTTTTTAQELVAKRLPADTELIFCPLDFPLIVSHVFNVLKPAGLVILETELWPNMIHEAGKRGLKTVLVNGRMSDRSSRGYRRFRFFFAPVLKGLSRICVQTETDRERYLAVAPELKERLTVGGNIKFDQRPPENLRLPEIGDVFSEGKHLLVTCASTHPGEEKFITGAWLNFRQSFPDTRLIIVPRHAERGGEIESFLLSSGLKVHRRSTGKPGTGDADILLADTTGELMGFMALSDIVIMGKTLAGNNEGQNIIEPAVLGKPIVCGMELRNFRQALSILQKAGGVVQVESTEELTRALEKLAADPEYRNTTGQNARRAIEENSGAIAENVRVVMETYGTVTHG